MVVEQSQQLQVEQNEFHLRVADALANSEGGAVNAIGPELEGPKRILEGEPAIVVAVPVDLHVGARSNDHALGESNEVLHPVGGGMTYGVA